MFPVDVSYCIADSLQRIGCGSGYNLCVIVWVIDCAVARARGISTSRVELDLTAQRACRSNCKQRPARYPGESKLLDRTLGRSAAKTGLMECSPHLPEASRSERPVECLVCPVETRRLVFGLES